MDRQLENKNDKSCLRLLEIKKSHLGLTTNEEKIFDKLIKRHTTTKPDRSLIHKELFDKEYIDCEILERDEYGGIVKDRFLIKPKGIEAISIYWTASKGDRIAKKKTQSWLNTAEKIRLGLLIVFGFSTLILGWLKYYDDKTIDELKQENIQLRQQLEEFSKKKINTAPNPSKMQLPVVQSDSTLNN